MSNVSCIHGSDFVFSFLLKKVIRPFKVKEKQVDPKTFISEDQTTT